MNAQTNAQSKTRFGEFVKKHCNYPMLLFAIVSIAGIGGILGSFIGIFSTVFTAPLQVVTALFSFVLSATPVVFLVLLWLDRFDKIKNATRIIIIFLIFEVIGILYNGFSAISYFFTHVSQYDAYTIFAESPFVIVLSMILDALTYLMLAIVLLCNKKKLTLYYVFIVFSIIVTLFFGVLTQMIGFGSLIGAFLTALSYIALWYIPKALDDSHAADLTPAKKKGLIAIATVTLCVFVVSRCAVGRKTSSYGDGERYDPNDKLYSDHDYNDDGHINQEEWEDALGDYMDDIMGQ